MLQFICQKVLRRRPPSEDNNSFRPPGSSDGIASILLLDQTDTGIMVRGSRVEWLEMFNCLDV